MSDTGWMWQRTSHGCRLKKLPKGKNILFSILNLHSILIMSWVEFFLEFLWCIVLLSYLTYHAVHVLTSLDTASFYDTNISARDPQQIVHGRSSCFKVAVRPPCIQRNPFQFSLFLFTILRQPWIVFAPSYELIETS